jgi:hypothetical protein
MNLSRPTVFRSSRSLRHGAIVLLALAVAWNVVGRAQPPGPREPRFTLPDHFAPLVDGVQRERIYAIQETYAPKLAELRRQLQELEGRRDREIEAVLRPEQLERLREFRAAAEARKRAREAEAPPRDPPPANGAPVRPEVR